MAATMTSSEASMTTRLISKLSLSNQEESVDLGSLRCPEKGVQSALCGVSHRRWMHVKAKGDPYLFTFSDKRDDSSQERRPLGLPEGDVEIQELPAALKTVATTGLIGKTIESVLQVRVSLTLSLNDSVRLGRRTKVPHVVMFTVKFRYDRLLGRCHTCAMINHGGLPCSREQEPVQANRPRRQQGRR
ncbi:hypothetical protein ACLB2K_053152 [Fragaria x ananassa]